MSQYYYLDPQRSTGAGSPDARPCSTISTFSNLPGSVPVRPRQPSQGRRCLSVLRHGGSFAAIRSPQVFLATDPDLPKVHTDHVAHLSSSEETTRCRLIEVQQ